MKKISLLYFCLILINPLIYSQDYLKYSKQAEEAYNAGDFPKALEWSDKAYNSINHAKKANRNDILEIKSAHGVYMILNGKEEEGLKLQASQIESIEKNPAEPKAEIKVRTFYGYGLKLLALYQEALPQFLRALELSEKHGSEKEDIADLYGTVAECYGFNYDNTNAEKFYKKSIAYCEKEKLTNKLVYVAQFNGLASLYANMELQSRALETFKKAEELFKSINDTLSPDFAIFLNNYSTLLAEINELDAALAVGFRSKLHTKRIWGENSEDYANVLNNIGFIYSKMNKVIETEQYYTRALELRKAQSYYRIGSQLNSINNLMNFMMDVGRTEDAGYYAKELEKGLADSSFTDSLKRAIYANNLAIFFNSVKNYEKAEQYFSESLACYTALFGPAHETVLTVLNDISVMLMNMGKTKEAVEILSQLGPFYQQDLFPDVNQQVLSLVNVAANFQLADKFDAAEKYINNALDICKNNKSISTKSLENVWINKAIISADLNKIDESILYFHKYLDLKYNQIEKEFAYMTETEKIAYLSKMETSIKNFFTTISNFGEKRPELYGDMLNFRLRTKGMILNNITRIKKSLIRSNDYDLLKKYQTLRIKRENISKLMTLDTEEYPQALSEIEALKKESDILEKEISLKVSQTEFNGGAFKNDWKQLQATLKKDEAAIEIIQSKPHYVNDGIGTNYTYIILKSSGNPKAVMIDRTDDWEKTIMETYRNSVNLKTDEAELYRRLWKHLDDQLKGIKTVYVSSDGIYNQINLNGLLNPESGKHVIDEKEIHYVVSLNDLMNRQTATTNLKNAVLFGDPDFSFNLSELKENKDQFGKAIASRGAGRYQLDDLPGTKTEVESIVKMLKEGNVEVVSGLREQANEMRVKKVNSPQLLHIATHGFFEEDYPEESLAELSRAEQEYYRNPMMRSGLFFAGSNNSYSLEPTSIDKLADFEDGILTAYEVMNLDLNNTQLVVLSACQTGLGKIKNGEGVFGLQRAFRLAGAKEILMSLWPVNDEATRDLMIAFYTELLKSGNTYQSFRKAQMEIRKKYPEPYYWASFILVGN